MKSTVTFKRNSKNVKTPMHLKNGVFLIYAPDDDDCRGLER